MIIFLIINQNFYQILILINHLFYIYFLHNIVNKIITIYFNRMFFFN
jgi:hypothetical protein